MPRWMSLCGSIPKWSSIITEDDMDDTEKTVLLETKGVTYFEDEEVTVERVAKAELDEWKKNR